MDPEGYWYVCAAPAELYGHLASSLGDSPYHEPMDPLVEIAIEALGVV